MSTYARAWIGVAIASLAACGGQTSEPGPAADTGSEAEAAADAAPEADATAQDAPDAAADSASDAADSADSADSADAADAAATPCTPTGGECAASEYCNAPNCASGTCAPRPASSSAYAPTCGCDGVNYWNADYAHALGKSTIFAKAECGTVSAGPPASTCGGFAAKRCPDTSDVCVVSGASSAICGAADMMGTCWSWPAAATCPGVIITDTSSCGASGVKCKGKCDALLSKQPLFTDASCPV